MIPKSISVTLNSSINIYLQFLGMVQKPLFLGDIYPQKCLPGTASIISGVVQKWMILGDTMGYQGHIRNLSHALL